MKKYFICLAVSGLFVFSSVSAQNADQQVIASSGGHHESGGYMISWTLGETVIATLDSGDYILTQGFQQSSWDIIQEVDPTGFEHAIHMWPNPATELVNVEVFNGEKPATFEWKLINVSGQALKKGLSDNGWAQIELSGLENAMYFIAIQDENGAKTSYKLIKQ